MKPFPAALLVAGVALHAQAPSPSAIHFVHGQWFDGSGFVSHDVYVEDGVFTDLPRDPAHAITVDLHNGFAVPPYGDAHEHNFDSLERTPAVDAEYLEYGIDLQHDNLSRLKTAGIPILVGSDHYGLDSRVEADYLQSFGLWSNLEMLRMWSVTTPQSIFPHRHLGELKPGYEASFLVLAADPLQSWPAVHEIVDRWKQGVHLQVRDIPPKP